jgi:uncharacterized protein (DUF362 family)
MEELPLDSQKSFVVISRAKELDYIQNYVSLPRNYGSRKYYAREDIQAIRELVFENLQTLNEKTKFIEKIKNQKVVIKPNLVGVFNNIGFKPKVSGQSTDPRIVATVVEFLKDYTDNIVIAEASGSGFPTRSSFKLAGLTRVAKKHNIELMPLEEQPVDRYFLPKAKAMKELLVPKIFSEVARGEAFYISMPKMKTNLYTDVTLGFKNAMGIIPLNLRQRDHNYNIVKKLVDILFLVKPDLTIIDGIIGSGGQCPARAEPTKSHMIVTGTNVVEVDRMATKLMGLDPEKVDLIKHASDMGFGDSNVEIIGDQTPVPFEQANSSLINDQFHENFPNIRALIAHDREGAPKVKSLDSVDQALMEKMELVCKGGCLACTKLGIDILVGEGVGDYEATIIIGSGVKVNGKGPYYFDRDGKAYTKEDIANIEMPTFATGDCTAHLKDVVDYHAAGCLYYPGIAHTILHKISNTKCVMMSTKNRFLLRFAIDMLGMRIARRRQIRKGNYVDISVKDINNRRKPEVLTKKQQQKDYIEWPLPPMDRKLKRQLRKEEWESVTILFKT